MTLFGFHVGGNLSQGFQPQGGPATYPQSATLLGSSYAISSSDQLLPVSVFGDSLSVFRTLLFFRLFKLALAVQ